MAEQQKARIVILGGGYAGLMAAIRLAGKARRQPVEITLINGTDSFFARILTHEVAVGKPGRRFDLAQLLRGTGVAFVQGWVEGLNPDGHYVTVKSGAGEYTLPYDTLVFALGSRVDQEGVPGVCDHAYVLNPQGVHGAADLQAQLASLAERGGQVVVVGGGATGIEGAAELHACYPGLKVKLVTAGEFGAFKGPRVQKYFRRAFERQGIAVEEGRSVQEVRAGALLFDDGTRMPFDLCLWAGGFVASPLAREAGLAVNERGQILTDGYLRALGQPDIFAVGDAAWPLAQPGAPMRMSVFVALVTGAYVADTLNRIVRGKAARPFSFAYYGQAVAVGRRQALGFVNFPDDTPVGPILTGWLGHYFRAGFVWYTAYVLKIEKRLPGFLFWLGKRRVRTDEAGAITPVAHKTTGVRAS